VLKQIEMIAQDIRSAVTGDPGESLVDHPDATSRIGNHHCLTAAVEQLGGLLQFGTMPLLFGQRLPQCRITAFQLRDTFAIKKSRKFYTLTHANTLKLTLDYPRMLVMPIRNTPLKLSAEILIVARHHTLAPPS
jgi:hypothetical protein